MKGNARLACMMRRSAAQNEWIERNVWSEVSAGRSERDRTGVHLVHWSLRGEKYEDGTFCVGTGTDA